ncbi:hypothetical protein ACS5PN_28960 [Roseateles sp. NT4]|uniref:hypothetical protein n=1 Tax=Roseateles sp. NT4 TaxID=3453715 RepID=UPI003EE8830E
MLRFIIYGLLLMLCAATALFVSFPGHAREYWRYLTQSRPALVLNYADISQDWTEQQLKERFASLELQCYDNRPGESLDDRSCYADIGSHDGMPAMNVAFHLKAGKLNHLGVQVPWWAHGRHWRKLEATYGKPLAAQQQPVQGVRLSGWQLSDGALFFNRDRPLNPLMWSMVFWSSERACGPRTCFTPAREP